MMKRHKVPYIALLLTMLWTTAAVAAERAWDAAADVARLSREVPSIQAFGTEGIVWLDAYNYSLLADGTMRKENRYLMLLDEDSAIEAHTIQYPLDEGASIEITGASWFNPSDGSLGGSLPIEELDTDGIRAAVIRFPAETRGKVVAIASVTAYPMRYYMDDVLPMSGPLPVWEQEVNVIVPEGMDVYWEGVGVRAPERSSESGSERITWSILNQPAWQASGLVEEQAPMLLFSLQRGLVSHLKNLGTAEASFRAPAVPQAILSQRGNLSRAGELIHKYLAERVLTAEGLTPVGIRSREYVAQSDRWTDWERTLIAGKWFQELGWDVKVFWCQKMPINQLGPSSSELWSEPLLQITQPGGKDVFYQAGQATDFGKLAPALYGLAVYRSTNTEIERLVLPRGSASEHTLTQTWKMSMDSGGMAEGTLELTVTGAWMDALGLGRTPTVEGLTQERVQAGIRFPIPGLRLEAQSVKILGSGYRVTFGVNASMGIVSGGDILMQMPAAIPVCFDEIPTEEARYSFKFPFLLERNAILTTPSGYKPMMLPAKNETGDSKAQFEESMAHWPKKSRIESSSKWTVRTTLIDEYFSHRIADQLAAVRRWAQTSIPLRK